MKSMAAWVLALVIPAMAIAAQPWQGIVMPTVSEAAATFPKPPMEYRAIHWAIWGGQQTKERVIADIDRIAANGGGVYMINNSQRVQPPYLSPEYMDVVKAVVQQCKKHGMKVWIEGDCGYPDGFAGGIISKEYPQLGMQGIVTDARCTIDAGQTLDIPMPVDVLGIIAYPRAVPLAPAADAPVPERKEFPIPANGVFNYTVPREGAGELTVELPNVNLRYSVTVGEPFSIPVPAGTKSIYLTTGGGGGGGGRGGRGGAGAPQGTIVPLPASGNLKWTAPAGTGSWDVTFIRHAYRTSPTRNDNGEDGGATKDSLYTLIDYLDPAATDTYLKVIYGAYEKAVGEEFGKTVMGFRADETDYTGVNPWTPKLLETFQATKGYDFKPYVAQIFGSGRLSPEAVRAKADYWDVWSAMMRDNFYKRVEDWCTSRNMEFMFHLNHEELMMSNGGDMIKNHGSMWRSSRYVGVPGIDNLNQIRPGLVADFPKLLGSAAHLFGRSLCWSEAGGGVGQTGKFITDYQLVRGINYLNIRGMTAPEPAGDAKPLINSASATGWYVGRAGYLMALGRPAAQVALYHPTDSMWLGDKESDDVTVKLTTQLMEQQIDFDHIDNETLASICTLEGGGLKNLSGQVYRAVIVPPTTVISKSMLDRLRDFAKAGGKVAFVGRTPTLVADRTYVKGVEGAPDLSFATLEPTTDITPRVVAAMPKPDFKLDSACPPIKYMHRSLKDGEVYFIFNESAQQQTRTVTLVGTGQVQVWDATDGTIHPLAGVAKAAGSVDVPLVLGPQESRFIVIGALPNSAGPAMSSIVGSKTVAAMDGDWSVTLDGKSSTTTLKSWQEMGATSIAGIAEYRSTFTSTAPQGQRVYLDLGNVREVAKVKVNGTELEARAWAPYVWDVTSAIKAGENKVEVQVQAVVAAGGRGGGGGGGRGAGAGRRGGGAAVAPAAPAAPVAADPVGLLGPVRVITQ